MLHVVSRLSCSERTASIIATGATPIRPVIDGIDLPGVFLLHSMADSFAVDASIREKAPQSALIIGGGYIGLEMADTLTLRGINVTLVEHHPTVLKTVDTAFGSMVVDELQRHGVTIISGTRIEHINPQQDHLHVLCCSIHRLSQKKWQRNQRIPFNTYLLRFHSHFKVKG